MSTSFHWDTKSFGRPSKDILKGPQTKCYNIGIMKHHPEPIQMTKDAAMDGRKEEEMTNYNQHVLDYRDWWFAHWGSYRWTG